ncbi:hypothetical protein AKJ43_01275 [candidate division MSBL1 archaeon SCGC-AAA261D19]|nr:hypothetical protein AKJ43_01275 [candidate division MSBL1 archaeon SCGC-AAA261D19]
MEKLKGRNRREKVLEFLKKHKGEGFTGEEIKEKAGVSIEETVPRRFPRSERIMTTMHKGPRSGRGTSEQPAIPKLESSHRGSWWICQGRATF